MVAKLLSTHIGLQETVSATTRSPRPDEISGRDYYFLSSEEFDHKLRDGEFLEHERVFGNLYGTLKDEVERKLKQSSLLLELDTKGAFTIRNVFKENSVLIFVSVPSIEELKKRLESRKTEPLEIIERRLKKVAEEIEDSKRFDYVVLNDKMDKAYKELEAIINKERGQGF